MGFILFEDEQQMYSSIVSYDFSKL